MIGILQRDVNKKHIKGETLNNLKIECFYGKQVEHYEIEKSKE